jgi:hypothetical protein
MGLSRTAKSWMLPALLVLLGAAWHPPAQEMPPQRGVAVTIDNRLPVDVRIYVTRHGTDILLGRVDGLEQRELLIAPALLGAGDDLHLLAVSRDLRATIASPVVPVEAGSRIDWRIERPPLLSPLFVR